MKESAAVRFLYGTVPGRATLKVIQKTRADRVAVAFLCSPCSRPVVGWYASRNGISLTAAQKKEFRTFQSFFARRRLENRIDGAPDHLISPCDGWLSAFPIEDGCSFSIKGSRYRLGDLLQDEHVAGTYLGGDCLVFRLCASDYHHYIYIDDGVQSENHVIPGVLHSVQPIACATYPVFRLNRRSWTLLATEHFGPVVQTEIGALIVGGIVNDHPKGQVRRGEEKGHFDLAGSTIVLLFQRDRIRLLPDMANAASSGVEVQVKLGMQIGVRK